MSGSYILRTLAVILATVFTINHSHAQAGDYTVTERGPDWRVMQKTAVENGTNRVHRYTELATGMHYKNASGQWVESKELIEVISGGAIARQGQHRVIFASNLNSRGSIDLQTPDGKRLRSNVLGLGYTDSATGKSVLIAQIQDSQGELIPDNQVLYPDAFDGVKADVRYTYRRGGFEQDVILREQPPKPETFGLNPDTTELMVMTEFLNPPKAEVKEHRGKKNGDDDQEISWGTMRLGNGKAFDLDEPKNARKHVAVQKRYETVNGRNILLEIVPVKTIQTNLSRLPLQSSAGSKLPVLASQKLVLPSTPLAKADDRSIKPVKLASASPAGEGYVLDYYVEVSGFVYDNFTFQTGMTYYINGWVCFRGDTATMEGGAVLKFAKDGGCLGSWNSNWNFNWQSTPDNPVSFTAVDDDSVGETISGSTGSPAGYYGGSILSFSGNATNLYIHDIRMSYLETGISGCYGSGGITVANTEFVNCDTALYSYYSSGCVLRNVLVAGGNNVMINYGNPMICENCTFHNTTNFDSGWGMTDQLTNCLAVGLQNWTGIDGNGYNWYNAHNRLLGDNAGFFRPGTMPCIIFRRTVLTVMLARRTSIPACWPKFRR